MLKAYKYRIYPNKTQQGLIDFNLSVCRLVYNLALDTKIQVWQASKINLSAYDLHKQLTELKGAYPWMHKADITALQASITNMDAAFKGFFNGNGFPKFKRRKGEQAYQCRRVGRINWLKSTLSIPKIKDIPISLSREFKGQVRMITIRKTLTGKYYASILVKNEQIIPSKEAIHSDKAMGIDAGIKSFAVCSNGLFFEPNRFLKNSLKRLQCLQRRASRKKKGSNNRQKANKCVAILHERITNQRVDYCHKVTTGLIRDNQTDTFVIEDLNVAGMMSNRKLSQAISDVGFGEFRRQMQYKCDWYGKNLIVIDRFAPTSKRCSDCGEINQELTLADREWTCACGSHHDRDLNAAKNIKRFGLQQVLNNSPEVIGEEPAELRRIRRAKKQEVLK